MSKYFLIIIFICIPILSQTETNHWKTSEPDYRLKTHFEKDYNLDSENFSTTLVSAAQIAYYKIFSDYDGDNCPFYPSCSAFFVQSVEQTNLIKGSLMFADRFTRDLNLFKVFNDYPLHSTGKFSDPVYKYSFNSAEELVELSKPDNDK